MADWLNKSPSNPSVSSSASPRVGLTTWGLRLRYGGLVTELSPPGWLALLSPGVVIGLLIARLTDNSFVLFGVVGGVAIWAAAIVVDRVLSGHRGARMLVEPPLSASELEQLEESSRYAGIKFEHRVLDESGSALETKAKYVARLRNLVALARDPEDTQIS